MKSTVLKSVLALAAALVSGPSFAGFDLAGSLTGHTNPADIQDWSFGRMNADLNPGSFAAFSDEAFQVSDINIWTLTGGPGSYPALLQNRSDSVVTIGSVVFQPDEVAFHPGFTDASYGAIRYAVAASGLYNLVGAFGAVDTSMGLGDGVELLIRLNSAGFGTSVLFSGSLASYEQGPLGFNFSNLSLSIGDTVDFLVGQGSNGNFNYDGTGVAATFSPFVPAPPLHSPQPASVSMAAIGLVALTWAARRSRRPATITL